MQEKLNVFAGCMTLGYGIRSSIQRAKKLKRRWLPKQLYDEVFYSCLYEYAAMVDSSLEEAVEGGGGLVLCCTAVNTANQMGEMVEQLEAPSRGVRAIWRSSLSHGGGHRRGIRGA